MGVRGEQQCIEKYSGQISFIYIDEAFQRIKFHNSMMEANTSLTKVQKKIGGGGIKFLSPQVSGKIGKIFPLQKSFTLWYLETKYDTFAL